MSVEVMMQMESDILDMFGEYGLLERVLSPRAVHSRYRN